MKKRILIIALVVIAAIAAVPLIAASHMRGHSTNDADGFGLHVLGKLDHIREELDLTDAQTDQIRTIFRDVRDQNKPYRQQMKGGLHDVMTTLLTDPSNTAAAQTILDRQNAAERTMKQNMLNATARALNVLTPEQRTKLAQLMGEHRARMQHR